MPDMSPPTQKSSRLPQTVDLLMTGALDGAWLPLAHSLAALLAEQGMGVAVVSAGAAVAASEEHPDQRVLVWLEAPERVAAYHVAACPVLDASLDRWGDQSAALIRAARRRMGRWLLINSTEAQQAPDALADMLAAWMPALAQLPVPAWPADPLRPTMVWLGQMIVSAQPRWRCLQDEFSAACTVLLPSFDDQVAAPDPACLAEDLRDILDQLQELRRGRQDDARRLTELVETRQAQAAESAALAARAAEAQTSAASLMEQLHLTQEQLESQQLEREMRVDLQARLDQRTQETHALRIGLSQTEAQRNALAALVERLEQALAQSSAANHQCNAELAALASAREADFAAQVEHLQAEHRGTLAVTGARVAEQIESMRAAQERAHLENTRRVERLQAENGQLRQESVSLMGQLHAAQEQLEQAALHNESMERTHGLLNAASGNLPTVADTRVRHMAEAGPHRHLDIDLIDLSWPHRHMPQLALRLVDHGGSSGLLFWDAPEGQRALMVWQPNGEEGGKPFMLLVPDDPKGREMLQRMGRHDWQTVLGLSRLLHILLNQDPTMVRWVPAATRLCRQLEHMAPRLRYDDMIVSPDGAAPAAILLRFIGTCFGQRDLGDIVLRWMPERGLLHWLAPERPDRLALIGWPVNDQGQPADRFELPVGTSGDRRNRWQRLHPADQTLLLGALDAIAGVSTRLSTGQLPDGLTPQRLARLGAALRRQAHGTLGSLRARTLVRRLVNQGQAEHRSE